MTYEYDDTGLIQKLLSSSRGTVIDVSTNTPPASKPAISDEMTAAITGADIVWLLGLPNRNGSGSKMWVDIGAEEIFDSVSVESKTFLENGRDCPKTLRLSFTQTEQVGLAFISLENVGRRILFGLNKNEGVLVSSFQIKDGPEWVESGVGENGTMAGDMFLLIDKAKEVAIKAS